MAQYVYTARAMSGELATGVLSAQDRRTALERVVGLGYAPVSIREADARGGMTGRRVRAIEVASFARRLSVLLRAGIPMVPALRAVRDQGQRGPLMPILQGIIVRIEHDSAGLAEAMASTPRVFDPVFQAMVRAGEQGGDVKRALEDAAEYLARANQLRAHVRNAMIYPCTLLLAGVIAIGVLMTSVVPRFRALFESFGQELPLPTRVLISLSDAFTAWWWAVALGLAAIVVCVMVAMRRSTSRRALDRALLTLPIVGDILLKVEVARLARTLAQLLQARVPLVEALWLAARVARNHAIQAAFGPVASGITEGRPLGACMAETGVFPALMLTMVRTGEQSGQLPAMLTEVASIYEDEAQRAVTAGVKLLEPALIVALGLVVAGIVAAIMLPVFSASAMVS